MTTAQHREMLDQMLATFELEPDVDLGLMRERQLLADLTAAAIPALARTIAAHRPDAFLVQGDTTTAFCAALAAFYAGVPVGHVEAGLRTGDARLPYPEEVNRRLVSVLARWHWCPTRDNAEALRREGVDPRRHRGHRQHGDRRAAGGSRAGRCRRSSRSRCRRSARPGESS